MSEVQNNNPFDAAKFAKGGLKLAVPIQDGDNVVEELKFDFYALTGLEYCEAVETSYGEKGTAFALGNKQALRLFAAAAAKCTDGVDQKDIIERMAMQDAMKAVQLATLFFNIASREGDSRFTDAQ